MLFNSLSTHYTPLTVKLNMFAEYGACYGNKRSLILHLEGEFSWVVYVGFVPSLSTYRQVRYGAKRFFLRRLLFEVHIVCHLLA